MFGSIFEQLGESLAGGEGPDLLGYCHRGCGTGSVSRTLRDDLFRLCGAFLMIWLLSNPEVERPGTDWLQSQRRAQVPYPRPEQRVHFHFFPIHDPVSDFPTSCRSGSQQSNASVFAMLEKFKRAHDFSITASQDQPAHFRENVAEINLRNIVGRWVMKCVGHNTATTILTVRITRPIGLTGPSSPSMRMYFDLCDYLPQGA